MTSRSDVANLIATDPAVIIPALQTTQNYALLSEEMIPHIASKFVLATRFDLVCEKTSSFVALQLAVRDVIVGNVEDLCYRDRRRSGLKFKRLWA
ncbi:hypothetical protein MN608_11486 [Microdochium nivale]|nr:hypothetical protein MN608_11486 [Microdochium nivale]